MLTRSYRIGKRRAPAGRTLTIDTVQLPETCSRREKLRFSNYREWVEIERELRAIDERLVEHQLYGYGVTLGHFLLNVPQVGYSGQVRPVLHPSQLDRRGSFLGGHPWTSAQRPWPRSQAGAPAAPLVQIDLGSAQGLTSLALEPVVVQIWSLAGAEVQVRVIPRAETEGEAPANECLPAADDPPRFAGGMRNAFALEILDWLDPKIILPSSFVDEPCLDEHDLSRSDWKRVREIFERLQGQTSSPNGYGIQLFGLNEGRQVSPDEHYKDGRGLLLNVLDRGDPDIPGLDLFSLYQELSLFGTRLNEEVHYTASIDGN